MLLLLHCLGQSTRWGDIVSGLGPCKDYHRTPKQRHHVCSRGKLTPVLFVDYTWFKFDLNINPAISRDTAQTRCLGCCWIPPPPPAVPAPWPLLKGIHCTLWWGTIIQIIRCCSVSVRVLMSKANTQTRVLFSRTIVADEPEGWGLGTRRKLGSRVLSPAQREAAAAEAWITNEFCWGFG